jgi:hypothetical protein
MPKRPVLPTTRRRPWGSERRRDPLPATALLPSYAEDLSQAAYRFSEALFEFEHQTMILDMTDDTQVRTLRDEYHYAVRWLHDMAANELPEDHTDRFLIDQMVLGLADDLEVTASALAAAYDAGTSIDRERLHELHRRLVWIFTGAGIVWPGDTATRIDDIAGLG